ncbi:MAG: 2-oxoacid:acceptor oxidoreductase family protein [Candidatus Desantisbacteria bacterium]
MAELTEIRWHGRGGQGAKTAAILFADAALGEGKYVQAFPEYGPERMGAPVQSYNRLSDKPITIHCGVKCPRFVAVLDPTLMDAIDVTNGLPDDGVLLINTKKTPQQVRAEMQITGRKVFTVDASGISKRCLGREIPNTPMLGALVKISGLINFERMVDDTRKKLEKKFKTKPEMIDGNVMAIKAAYDEVHGEAN